MKSSGEIKKEVPLEENRKKSRSILLTALLTGMKQDEKNKAGVQEEAQEEHKEDDGLAEELNKSKGEKEKVEKIDIPDFVMRVQPADLANEIEMELYKQLYLKEINSWKDYNSKLRSLSFNLKDPKNPYLRIRLLSRELEPSLLPPISSADLANPELTNMRKNLAEKALKNVTLDAQERFKMGPTGQVGSREALQAIYVRNKLIKKYS